ncbi:MAG: hypothetical protein P8189_23280 [Anaerolineae bacterium]
MPARWPCAYDLAYGDRDSVMANPAAPDCGQCSARFSALAQEWIFLAIVNHETGFVWEYLYRDPGVGAAHREIFGSHQVYLPMIVNAGNAETQRGRDAESFLQTLRLRDSAPLR